MKVKIVSDIHLEYCNFQLKYTGEDILVLAGDISPNFEHASRLIIEYLNSSNEAQVIFVLGNHDYYGSYISEPISKWKSLNLDRFHILENDYVEIESICFYGATMWTDIDNRNRTLMISGQTKIADFQHIIDFTPDKFCSMHNNSKNLLKEFLDTRHDKVVVITHHLPTYKSIDVKYKNNDTNSLFASTDLQDLVNHDNVRLWIHGHTHSPVDYYDGETRVLCNPRGEVKMWKEHVKKRENKNFDSEFILDI
jgi:predicted phosphodiesterase